MQEDAQPRPLLGDRRPAPGDLRLVQELVNTHDLETGDDALGDPRALRAWLLGRGLIDDSARVTEPDLVQARALRESLRALLLSHVGVPPAGGDLAAFGGIAQEAKLVVVLGETAPQLAPAAAGVAGAWGRLLAAIATAVTDGTWTRLKACRSDTCHGAFYDQSRNNSGRWCSLESCGTPAKMRRYRQAKRLGRAGTP